MAATAQRFGTRPSVLLDVRDPWEAFCLDEALHIRAAIYEDSGEQARDEPPVHEPPDERTLRLIDWRGDGDDPLDRGAEG